MENTDYSKVLKRYEIIAELFFEHIKECTTLKDKVPDILKELK